jgi:putative copper export protein
MKKAFTILVGFIHDFAAGCWAATVLAVYRLEQIISGPGPQADLSVLQKEFFYIGIVCIFIVFGAGAGRTFTYVQNVYGEDAEKSRRKMLIVKHMILLVVFGSGTFWQYTMTYRH